MTIEQHAQLEADAAARSKKSGKTISGAEVLRRAYFGEPKEAAQ